MEFQNRGIAAFAIAAALCMQPTRELFEALAETEPAFFPESNDSPWCEIASAWARIKSFAQQLTREDEGAATRLAAEYTRLFRGLVPGRWARPAYEATYLACTRDEEMAIIQQVSSLYRRAGITINVQDRPDFIAIELDAMRELLGRGALGNAGALDFAQELFADHLQKWVPAQATEASAVTHEPFYQAVFAYLRSIAAADFPTLAN